MTTDELVVACALHEAGLAAQSERWAELRRRAEVGRQSTPDGRRLFFRADPGVRDELDELVAVENRCCSWATWTVAASGNELALEVTSTGHGVDALHRMFSA